MLILPGKRLRFVYSFSPWILILLRQYQECSLTNQYLQNPC